MDQRKPLLILGILGLLAVVLFVVGAAGAGRADTGGDWPGWATPDLSPGSPLTGQDLTGDASCAIDGTVISFVGVCRVQVREITGGWPWEAATRRAILVVVTGPVDLAVSLAGRALQTDLDPGDRIRLTYTRQGGSLTLACGNPVGCSVALLEDA